MGDDGGGRGDITDISNSPAYTFLDELHQAGKITQAQCEMYKSKYEKLHEIVLKTYENEKMLLKKAKALNQELLAEKLKLEKSQARTTDDSTTLANLNAELSKGEAEQQLCEERESMLDLEISELNRHKAELLREMEARKREEQERLKPQKEAIDREIEELRGEIEENRIKLKDMQDNKTQCLQNMAKLRAQLEELETEKNHEGVDLLKVKSEPDRMRKQVDVVQNATKGLQKELERMVMQITNLENDLAEQSKIHKDMESQRVFIALELDRQREKSEHKKRVEDELKKSIEQAKESADGYNEEKKRMDMLMENLTGDVKKAAEELAKRQREKEQTARKVKKVEHALQSSKAGIFPLDMQRKELERTKQDRDHEKKNLNKAKEEVQRDVDIYINSFLKQEVSEKEESNVLQNLLLYNKELEQQVAEAVRNEQRLNRNMMSLSSQREIMSREAARALANKKETIEDLKMKDLVIMDLVKRHDDLTKRLKEFSNLYELVKNERNKYVNLIQASQQALAEMKEKTKILQNEIEILRNECVTKDAALVKTRLEHQNAFYGRDATRSDTNKAIYTYRTRQEQVDQQIAEIDRLNAIINQVEKEMLQMKKKYEIAVEDRNYTGIQLIDRNDELCILYEKSNIQEQILKNGEIETRKREEEIRMLKIQLAETQRQIEVLRIRLPHIPEYEREISSLTFQLQDEREIAEKLSQDLESPENHERWRALGGKDPDKDELVSKIQLLEQRLNDKKETLLEKELVLEEVTTLSDRLRKQAIDGREDTLELAKTVNEFQGKIKTLTRKMMATVSELSMYQATAMKLQQEKHEKEVELESASWRLEHGEPPTDDAEREWFRMERNRLMRREEMLMRRQQQETEADMPDGPPVTRTTAEPRPNAYIAEDLGLPTPYGAKAPFKPTEPGSSMRHIRKPVPREIVT